MRTALVERAKVLWLEGVREREKPLWLEIEGIRLEVISWQGSLHPSHREFMVETPLGWFLIIQDDEDMVYYLPMEIHGEKGTKLKFPSGREIAVEVEGKFLKIHPVGKETEVFLWTEGLPVLFFYGEKPELPWNTRPLQGILSGEILSLSLPFYPVFPIYLAVKAFGESLPPEFLRNNPFSYIAIYLGPNP